LSGFQMVRYSNARDRHKIQFEYRRRFGIRMLTVYISAYYAVICNFLIQEVIECRNLRENVCP
jgi:hypothetical protein